MKAFEDIKVMSTKTFYSHSIKTTTICYIFQFPKLTLNRTYNSESLF